MDYEAGEGKRVAAAKDVRAQTVSLGDFSEQLTAGVLRAIDARDIRPPRGGGTVYPPWVWCGIWVRPPMDFDKDLLTDAVKKG